MTSHTAVATIRYLGDKGAVFGLLRVNACNRVWFQNRPLLGEGTSKALPEDTNHLTRAELKIIFCAPVTAQGIEIYQF